MTPTDEAPVIFADRVQSLNYDGPDGAEVFADAGTLIDLDNGTITSTGLVVDGVTGDVSVRGDVTASSFTMLGVGEPDVVLAEGSFVDPFNNATIDGVLLESAGGASVFWSGSGSIAGVRADNGVNATAITANTSAFTLSTSTTASWAATLTSIVGQSDGGLQLSAATFVSIYADGGADEIDLFGHVNVFDSGAGPLDIGLWSGGGGWGSVQGVSGYLLLGRLNMPDDAVYLRSSGIGSVYIGSNGANTMRLANGGVVTITGSLSVNGPSTFDAVSMGGGLDMNQNNITDGNSIYMDNWYRSTGDTGWYNETRGAGIHCSGDDWIRTYSSGKGYYTTGNMGAAGMPNTATAGGGRQYVLREPTFGTFQRFTSRRDQKDNIAPIVDSGAIVDALDPVTFTERITVDDPPGVAAMKAAEYVFGFIADDVFAVADARLSQYELNDTGDGFTPIGWDWPGMIAVAVAELKSLRARVAELESTA